MVSHLNFFKYDEMDGEFIDTPCQAFEVIPPTIGVAKATIPEVSKDTPRIASLKDARVVVKDGGCTIWGQLPDIPNKYDKFGLGFTSKAQKEVRRVRAGGHLSVLATMKSMLWKKLTMMVTWTTGYSQLLMMDLATGRPNTSSQSPSARSNRYFLFLLL